MFYFQFHWKVGGFYPLLQYFGSVRYLISVTGSTFCSSSIACSPRSSQEKNYEINSPTDRVLPAILIHVLPKVAAMHGLNRLGIRIPLLGKYGPDWDHKVNPYAQIGDRIIHRGFTFTVKNLLKKMVLTADGPRVPHSEYVVDGSTLSWGVPPPPHLRGIPPRFPPWSSGTWGSKIISPHFSDMTNCKTKSILARGDNYPLPARLQGYPRTPELEVEKHDWILEYEDSKEPKERE